MYEKIIQSAVAETFKNEPESNNIYLALLLAITQDNKELAATMLKHLPEEDITQRFSTPPSFEHSCYTVSLLTAAIDFDHPALIKGLLNKNKQIIQYAFEERDPDGNSKYLTPLQKTISTGKTDTITTLCVYGADINESTVVSQHSTDIKYYMTPLQYAIFLEKTDCIDTLIRLGANINQSSVTQKTSLGKYYETPLLCAISLEKTDCIDKLISLGADMHQSSITQKTPWGKYYETPLLFAMSYYNIHKKAEKSLDLLLSHPNLDINQCSLYAKKLDYRTPLLHAIQLDNPHLIEKLYKIKNDIIDKQVILYSTDKKIPVNPLHYARKHKKQKALKKLKTLELLKKGKKPMKRQATKPKKTSHYRHPIQASSLALSSSLGFSLSGNNKLAHVKALKANDYKPATDFIKKVAQSQLMDAISDTLSYCKQYNADAYAKKLTTIFCDLNANETNLEYSLKVIIRFLKENYRYWKIKKKRYSHNNENNSCIPINTMLMSQLLTIPLFDHNIKTTSSNSFMLTVVTNELEGGLEYCLDLTKDKFGGCNIDGLIRFLENEFKRHAGLGKEVLSDKIVFERPHYNNSTNNIQEKNHMGKSVEIKDKQDDSTHHDTALPYSEKTLQNNNQPAALKPQRDLAHPILANSLSYSSTFGFTSWFKGKLATVNALSDDNYERVSEATKDIAREQIIQAIINASREYDKIWKLPDELHTDRRSYKMVHDIISIDASTQQLEEIVHSIVAYLGTPSILNGIVGRWHAGKKDPETGEYLPNQGPSMKTLLMRNLLTIPLFKRHIENETLTLITQELDGGLKYTLDLTNDQLDGCNIDGLLQFFMNDCKRFAGFGKPCLSNNNESSSSISSG